MGTERQCETARNHIGDRERHVATPWDLKDSKRQTMLQHKETVRNKQVLHSAGRDSKRQPKAMRDSERNPATIGVS